MLCISAGSADELDKRGVANLLSHMFAKKLKESTAANTLQYGAESDSCTGHDQSMYYFYGKLEDLEGFIKNLGEVFSRFSCSPNDVEDSRLPISSQTEAEHKLDQFAIRREAKRSLYWQSSYGADVVCTPEQLKEITAQDANNFKEKHYTNNRVTVIVAGNVQKNAALKMVSKYFAAAVATSKIDRLQEPPHHGATTRIVKYSSQINVPVVEMYWRVPNYRNDRKKALAAEIFVRYLNDVLPKILQTQGLIASISFSYLFWSYDGGDFSITVTPKDTAQAEKLITAVLSEIKGLVSDGITKEQADGVVNGMVSSSNLLRRDTLDAVNWMAGKIGSGNEFDFVKEYPNYIKKYKLEDVNAQAKEIFKNDPCVISIVRPT
jgi:zinc protease